MSERRTVLVVDDEEALRLTVAANLEESGFRVLEARDGAEAVALVRSDPSIDVVVSDVRMPRLDGVAAFREIKRIRPGLPVILMTAFAQERLVFDAMVEGAFTVVHKPFDAEKLIAIAKNALTRPHVLVVDDTPEFRDTLCSSLATSGQRPLSTADGVAALDALRECAVDVAIIDLVLPGRDGVGVLQDVQHAAPSVRAIMVTGHDVPDLIRRSVEAGAHTALRKPFDVRELVRIIAELRGRPR
jgi:DNA-binding NtrC family response regulator